MLAKAAMLESIPKGKKGPAIFHGIENMPDLDYYYYYY